ncbi:rRNA pseudouridine synthase [Oscillibacter sp. MSJ-2]|uniref:Pseudouridine synthase n=1 Tax=Dysosmobacter acutus TaxID=2841504 RepID=A0ABS6FCP1_9FIRM|nr:pseudouridine synthase [Dysosmobacter acutus]MBU5627927.1 rRNA pseudouridine synthase [Dysosmobacter acutus]
MEKLRLDKIVSATGLYSRREVKALVRQGRILADGRVVRSADEKFDPEGTELLLDGRRVDYQEYTYLMMNKPAGVLSATEDDKGRTVLSLLPPELQKRNLFPVGRLDKDTEGLLLLTNDGPLAHELLAPRHHVDKVYFAQVDEEIEEADCRAFAEGMTLGDGLRCMPAQLRIGGAPDTCYVTLQEGKFHQVKRMLASRGKPVKYLKRLQMGNLTLDSALPPGAFRFLSSEELESLKNFGK